jgi:hypothetical protein
MARVLLGNLMTSKGQLALSSCDMLDFGRSVVSILGGFVVSVLGGFVVSILGGFVVSVLGGLSLASH